MLFKESYDLFHFVVKDGLLELFSEDGDDLVGWSRAVGGGLGFGGGSKFLSKVQDMMGFTFRLFVGEASCFPTGQLPRTSLIMQRSGCLD